MGFDMECIVDIHAYPGEYFCPVCRTLVNPNEAFQSQCTHLYCKPCLAHIANGSRACPYDGYLVTESDSKPLMESDKALAEKIGKVKVRCLYFRSGCTWEGSLPDCTSHCSECSFGNSAVICNRCGIQIAHRQAHEHALSCPGVFGGQQAVTKSGATSSTATADVNNQTVAQSGAAPPFAGKNPTVQSNAPVVAPVAGPTPEQWYQQQYQQYYQQYPGYDPYQQAGQQYYPPVQQQPFQQYQQHPLPVQSQNQPHLLQGQPQVQPNTVSQTPQQPNAQPQLQPQMQVPPRGQAPSFQVNQQQQPHPPMRPPQTLPPPPPQNQPMQPPPSSQALGMRPPAQHPQVPQYQQPHAQMPHPQPTQAHVQTQMHLHPQPQTHNQSPAFPPQATAPASMPQAIAAIQPPAPPVSGHHSYQQPQPAQNGATYQHQMHPHPATGSLHQVPQQPAMMRPPHSHGSLPQQQPPAVLPPQNQVPGVYPAQQFPPQPSYPIQHHPVMLPVQQGVAQQYAHQPTQPQLRPPYPPQTQQSQNYVGMPMMPNQGINLHSHPLSSGGFGPVAHSGPVVNQKYANFNVLEENEAARKTLSPSKGLIEKDSKGKSIKKEVISEKSGTVVKDTSNATEYGLTKSVIKQEQADVQGSFEQASGGKSFNAGPAEHKFFKEEGRMRQAQLDNKTTKSSNAVVMGPTVTNFVNQSHTVVSASTTEGQQRPQAQVQGQHPSIPAPQAQVQGHYGHRDDKLNAFSWEHLNAFPGEPMRSLDQSSRSFEKAPQRPTHEAESKFDGDAFSPNSRFLPHHHPSGGHGQPDTFGPGPEFGQDHKKNFASRSSDREYLGSSTQEIGGPSGFPRGISGFNDMNAREAHKFGEGTRSFNVSTDPVGNPFRDGRFPSLPDHPPRGEYDAPGVRKRRRDDDVFGQDEPDHLMRRKFPGPGNFSMGESSGPVGFHDRALVLGGPGNFPRPPFNGPVGGPLMRGSYPPPFAGAMESLDQMWKRNPVSMGWCRICRIDCETVEGLDMHSQTREHQNIAKDIVKTMKLQSKKKQRTSAGHMVHGSSSRGRKAGFVGRGS